MPDFGESPVPNVPTIRKGIPKFSRPGINLRRPEKKEWRDCSPHEIEVGDIIAGFGQIAHKTEKDYESGLATSFENIMGDNKIWFHDGDQVKAFVRVNG